MNIPVPQLEPVQETSVEPPKSFLDLYIQYARTVLPNVPDDYHRLVGLVIQAAIVGPSLRTDTNLQTNLAGVIVSVQGVGKTKAKNIGLDLLDSLHQGIHGDFVMQDFLIATQASVQGLLEGLAKTPSGIVDYDEFTAFLNDAQQKHMRSAKENICRALDGQRVRYLRSRNENVDIPNPCPSIIGTTNIAPLRSATKEEDWQSGFYSRFLFCAPDLDYDEAQVLPGDLHLREQLRQWLSQFVSMEPQTATISSEAHQLFSEYSWSISPYTKGQRIVLSDIAEDTNAATYIRYKTHAIKVALLLSAGETPSGKPVIVTADHAQRAIQTVERFRQYAVKLFDMLDDDAESRLIVRVEKYVLAAPGHQLKPRELQQKLGGKTDKKLLATVLTNLEKTGVIWPVAKLGHVKWRD